MHINNLEENVEFLSEKVHEAWQKEKVSQGFHAPNECKSRNHEHYLSSNWRERERFDNYHNPKFYKWCDKCHTDLYPYNELPENIKEYDRVTVRTVLNAIKEI